jgi:SAM-dependent methyltransferase
VSSGWEGPLATWWAAEATTDPAYRSEVLPLLLELLRPASGQRLLDLGCGDGRVMTVVAKEGALVVGCDLSSDLLARGSGMRVRARLPGLAWVAESAFDGAYAVLVLEHLDDVASLFEGAASAIRPGGRLVAVINHPVVTAPGSGPFVDHDDGEVLWRWGVYLEEGSTAEPAGDSSVRFGHRPFGSLLTAAAAAGWWLEVLEERGIGVERAASDPLLAVQAGIPRIAGIRWVRAP